MMCVLGSWLEQHGTLFVCEREKERIIPDEPPEDGSGADGDE